MTTIASTEATTAMPTTEPTTQIASVPTKPFVTEPTTAVATNDTATIDTAKPTVQTGGGVNVVVWIVMAVCALSGFVALIIAIKKNNEE